MARTDNFPLTGKRWREQRKPTAIVGPAVKLPHSLSFRPLALLLSLVAHICAGYALGSARSATGDAGRGIANAMVLNVNLLTETGAVLRTMPPDLQPQKPVEATDANQPASIIKPANTQIHDEPIAPQLTHSPSADSSGLPVLQIAEPRYYPVSELTRKPTVVQDIAPEMIVSLPDSPLQPAIVRLLINEQGGIDQVVIEESTLSDQARHFVTDSFAQVRFTPGMLGDLPVKSELRIEVTLEHASPPVTPVSISVVH